MPYELPSASFADHRVRRPCTPRETYRLDFSNDQTLDTGSIVALECRDFEAHVYYSSYRSSSHFLYVNRHSTLELLLRAMYRDVVRRVRVWSFTTHVHVHTYNSLSHPPRSCLDDTYRTRATIQLKKPSFCVWI
jgi:hypothetical protein